MSILPIQHEGKGWTNELCTLTSRKTWSEWSYPKQDGLLPTSWQRVCKSRKVNVFKLKMVRMRSTKFGATFIGNSMICWLYTNRRVHRWAASFNFRTFLIMPSYKITQGMDPASMLPIQHEDKGWTNELYLLTSQKTWRTKKCKQKLHWHL